MTHIPCRPVRGTQSCPAIEPKVPLGIWLCAPDPANDTDSDRTGCWSYSKVIARAVKEFSISRSTVLTDGIPPVEVDSLRGRRPKYSVVTTQQSRVSRGDGGRMSTGAVRRRDVAGRSVDLVVAAVEQPVSAAVRERCQLWERVLRPGGIAAVITSNPAGPDRFANHAGLVVDLATDAGLTYLQHVVAVTARVEGDRLLIPVDPSDRPSREDTAIVHVPAHVDVLVFRAGEQAASERRVAA